MAPRTTGTWSQPYAIPNDTRLIGVDVVAQAALLNLSGPLHVDLTNSLAMTMGR